MGVRIEALSSDGHNLGVKLYHNDRSFDCFLSVLAILFDTNDPAVENGQVWPIVRAEDDAGAYLLWFMWRSTRGAKQEGSDDLAFGSHEATLVLGHLQALGITTISKKRITEALNLVSYSVNEPLEFASNQERMLSWYFDFLSAIISLLRTVEQNEGSRLKVY